MIDFGVPDTSDDRAYPHVGSTWRKRWRAARPAADCSSAAQASAWQSRANKVPGIRATVAHDSYSVERSVLSNNCQVLTLGARVVGLELAKRLVDEWLDYEFDPESASAAKVAVISEFEERDNSDESDR